MKGLLFVVVLCLVAPVVKARTNELVREREIPLITKQSRPDMPYGTEHNFNENSRLRLGLIPLEGTDTPRIPKDKSLGKNTLGGLFEYQLTTNLTLSIGLLIPGRRQMTSGQMKPGSNGRTPAFICLTYPF